MAVHEGIIELYLQVKIRSNDEVSSLAQQLESSIVMYLDWYVWTKLVSVREGTVDEAG